MTEVQAGLWLAAKHSLTLEAAQAIAAAAHAEAIAKGWKVSIAIVDDGANLLYLERLDGAQIASADVAWGKAKTAMRYRRPSRMLEEAIAGGRVALTGVEGITPLQGALPIIHDEQIIGAIGVSGVQSAQDEQIAAAGLCALSALVRA